MDIAKDPANEFESLANEHKDAVYRQMLRVCGNREDAEDVLVEALLKAYNHMDQLRDSSAFRAWLAQIARRVCWQLKAREALQPLLQLSAIEEEGREIPSPGPSVETEVAAKELREILHDVVDGLASEYRTVYELRDLQELSGEEVATRLGISLAAMKTRLHRAREMVREQLDAMITRKRPVTR
jgi:RNA polymerase sigma-70 factor (ECF subfamily)